MPPIIDHIEITVRDMSTAVAFYDKLLPLLGFDVRRRVDEAEPSRAVERLGPLGAKDSWEDQWRAETSGETDTSGG